MQQAAIVIGASSGIGEAIARQLASQGWRVGVAARRAERLEALAADLGPQIVPTPLDLADPEEARSRLASLAEALGGVDLWVLNAGMGDPNPNFDWEPERQTIVINALGFAAMADIAFHHCCRRGSGHIVGISSVARFLRRPTAVGYAASKAFVSVYLDGLRTLARQRRLPVSVTEACPGFVRTAMMKAPSPFWVASPQRAAERIIEAALAGRKLVFVTRRWRLVAWALACLPR
ncbi:SDR family NAD(P)-dependent oxidoreductase [Acetobacteraceae bacterium H6797]|nr:SDR family NAD(P)-dependent oxidoreductase [Acetobacteraceae bacterium H6797]